MLKLLPYTAYRVSVKDPLPYYFWPVIGKLYQRRVELCLDQCSGGERVLDVGFGSGVAFPNLKDIYDEVHGLDIIKTTSPIDGIYLKIGSILHPPYPDDYFDTVLLVSVLEHLQPHQQSQAFQEIRRILKPGGQCVYGVPKERLFMRWMFRLLGCDIRQHHFSTEKDVSTVANSVLNKVKIAGMKTLFGSVYEIGCYEKEN